MPQIDTYKQTFTLAGTVAKYDRVKMSGASVVITGLTDRGIGVAQRAGVAGEEIEVRLDSAPSSMMKAAAAIVAGAGVWSAASGRVSVSASTAFRVGTAKEAATAAGDVIEVMPMTGDETVVA